MCISEKLESAEHRVAFCYFQNRFRLLQQLDSAGTSDEKKRVLWKLCNDCTGLELDLEKYALTYGKVKLPEKKKEEEDIDLDLAL